MVSFVRKKPTTQTKAAPKKEEPAQEPEAVETEVVDEGDVAAESAAPAETATETPPAEEKPKRKRAPRKKKEAPKEEVKTQAPAVRDDAQVSTAIANEDAGFTGDLDDQEDLQLPRINLVQKNSETSDDFEVGSFIFNKEIQLTENEEDSLNIIILRVHKYYQENTDYDSDEMGQIFATAEEFKKEGFTIGYKDEMTVSPVADLDCLVPCDDEDLAQYTFEGQGFVIGRWTVRSTAYDIFRKVRTAAKLGILKGRHVSEAGWEIKVKLNKQKKGSKTQSWFSPYVKGKDLLVNSEAGDAFAAFVAEIAQG